MERIGFDGRVVVVTGAGRGLGRAYALLLGERGARVVVNDFGGSISGEGHDEGPAQEVASEINAAGGIAVACGETVATREGAASIVQTAIDNFGRIDALIHNAGTSRPALIGEMTAEDFQSVLDVHVGGAFHLLTEAFPLMCEAGYGRIVLTTSTSGLYGSMRQANYGSGKTALMGLSNIAALEGAAQGVHCNLLAPGAVTRISHALDTSKFPRTMRPEVVAPLAAWLVHESCPASGEMFFSMAGRVGSFVLAETRGVYRSEWTLEEIVANADAIRDKRQLEMFPVIPQGHADHINHNFEHARAAGIEDFGKSAVPSETTG